MCRDAPRNRGQIEPIAALVAIFALSVGLAAYVGVVSSGVLAPDERSIEETTLDRVWNELGAEGVYADVDTDDIDDGVAPEGYDVGVAVTYTNASGETELVDGFAWSDRDRRWERWEAGDPEWIDYVADPPADARTASRPIAVENPELSGDLRGGTLRVVIRS